MKIFIRILALFMVISFLSVFGQEPGITWSKFYRPNSTLSIQTMAVAYDGHQLPNGDLDVYKRQVLIVLVSSKIISLTLR